MEVHHHSHSARKKWTHYFWEFLMLFLAVFCGFLAEMKLEHTIEHQREKRYVLTLLEDLKRDSADLVFDIAWWSLQMKRVDTIHIELNKKDSERNHFLLYQQVAYMRMYNAFEYHDRTIEQLRNAGNFRLIRKRKVADSLIDYDAEIRSTLYNIESGSTEIFMQLNFLQNKFFDTRYFPLRSQFRILDSLYREEPEKFIIKGGFDKEVFEFGNHLHFYRGNMGIRLIIIRSLLRKTAILIDIIRKEYNLK